MKRREFITSIFVLPLTLTGINSLEKKKENEAMHRILSVRRKRVLYALGESYFPDYINAETREDFIEKAQTYLASYSSDMRKGYGFIITFLEFLPILMFYSLRTFSSLPLEQRREFLDRMFRSRFRVLRTMLFALKVIPCLYYFSSIRVKESLGIKYKV